MKITMTIEEEIEGICYDHYDIIEPLTNMVERRIQEALDSIKPCTACDRGLVITEKQDTDGKFKTESCGICSGRGFVVSKQITQSIYKIEERG